MYRWYSKIVRYYEFREPTPTREQTVWSEDFTGVLQGEPGVSQPTEPTDDAEARGDLWSIQGDFMYRHHSEPRVQLCVSQGLDVMHEKRIEDYFWNVDSNRSLADSWKGFTKITLLKEKRSQGIYVVREEIDKSSNDCQTRSCMT